MDTTALGEPGEQPAAVTPVSDAGAQPQGSEPASTLDGFEDSQLFEALERLESGGAFPTTPEAPAAPVAAPAPVQAPPGETPAAPAADAAEAPPAAGEDGPQGTTPKGRVSVRILPPAEQVRIAEALDMVRHGKAPDFQTAYGTLAGAPATGTPPAPAAAAPDADAPPAPVAQAPAATPAVAEIQATIATLREERKAARRDFDNDRIDELTDQIEDAQANLLRAEQAAAVQAVESRSYNDRYADAVTAVEGRYEAARDENSVFNKILDDRITAAHHRGDPALSDPNFVIAFADEVAADLGLDRGTPIPPPPAKPARTVGDFAPGHHSSGRLSGEAASRLISQIPIEKLQELAFTE